MTVLSNVHRIKQLLTFVSVNMKCYWTVNNSYWPPLRVSQYEVNTSWPPQQKSIVLQYWKPKINSFSYAEKKIMAYVHRLLDQPSQWQTSQQAFPGSVRKFTSTSIAVKQLLIKNKKSISLNRIYWYVISFLVYSKHVFCFIFFRSMSSWLKGKHKTKNETEFCYELFYLLFNLTKHHAFQYTSLHNFDHFFFFNKIHFRFVLSVMTSQNVLRFATEKHASCLA